MRKISDILFAIWLFILSVLPCGIIYHTQSVVGSTVDKNAIKAVCRAVEQSYPHGSDEIRVATYNLLADGIGYYGGRDSCRSDGVCDLLCSVSSDVIGLQEVSRWWLCNLKDKTPYSIVDPLRTELGGFMTAIAYNPERVELLEYGNEALVRGSNPRLRRVVWGLFIFKASGKRFVAVNTHFNVTDGDNSAGLVQAQQVTQLVRSLNVKYACPVIITGDFNAKKRGTVSYCTSVIYDVLSLNMTDLRYPARQKISGGGKGLFSYCVDHVFAVGQVDVRRCAILSQRELLDLSDHYLMLADVVV